MTESEPRAEAPVCDTCGARSPQLVPLYWSSGVERGRRVWTCAACAREHLRSIEAKLDRDWW